MQNENPHYPFYLNGCSWPAKKLLYQRRKRVSFQNYESMVHK